MTTLSIVIPVFNEEATLTDLLDRVVAAPLPTIITALDLVVVDDCSGDTSWERLSSFEPKPRADGRTVSLNRIQHPLNRGKGAALRTAFDQASGDLLLIQDADLEYDPGDYPKLLGPIIDGHADVVYGSRFLGGPHRVLFFWHSVGNTVLTLLSNMLTDLNLTDMETCYKVFTIDVIRSMHLRSERFGIEPEMTARVARLGCRIYEVPISYHGRTYAEGKKIGWRDGISAIWSILRFNLFQRQRPSDGGPRASGFGRRPISTGLSLPQIQETTRHTTRPSKFQAHEKRAALTGCLKMRNRPEVRSPKSET